MTLKELEKQLQQEGKHGYAEIRLWPNACVRDCMIGYFEDIANYHGLSYEHTQVEYVGYKGW